MRLRPRLRTVLLALSFLTFALAWVALFVLRVYDNQLVRQTESELIAQGAFVAATYGDALNAAGAPPDYGLALPPEHTAEFDPARKLRPLQAHLDLGSDDVRPSAAPALPAPFPPDAAATAAGGRIAPILAAAKSVALSGTRVVDWRGVVVASSGEELGRSLAEREEVQRALRGESVSLARRRHSDSPRPDYESASRESGLRVFVALPVVEAGRVRGAVVMSRTPMTLGKAFYQDRYTLLVMAVALLSVVALVTLLAAAFVARPVRALIAQTRAVADGTGSMTPIARPGTREIAELSEAFARMAALLQQRADYIRAFAASVSHEFKTPLAAIHGTVELLREHLPTMDEARRARFLANMDADAARLDRLVQRLLDLARADMLQPTRERVSLASALRAFVDGARVAGREVALRVEGEPGEVQMGVASLEAVLESLVDNAIQHGGAAVRVTIEARRSGDRAVEILVRDDGAGISPANAQRVFDPFFTTSRERGGTGLGLTIARALLKAHDATIEHQPGDPGTTFRILVRTA